MKFSFKITATRGYYSAIESLFGSSEYVPFIFFVRLLIVRKETAKAKVCPTLYSFFAQDKRNLLDFIYFEVVLEVYGDCGSVVFLELASKYQTK